MMKYIKSADKSIPDFQTLKPLVKHPQNGTRDPQNAESNTTPATKEDSSSDLMGSFLFDPLNPF